MAGSIGVLTLVPVAWLLRWLAHGVTWTSGLGAIAFALGYVLVPGIAALRLLRLPADDLVEDLNLGGALGIAHLVTTYAISRLAGTDILWLVAPVVPVVALLGRDRGFGPSGPVPRVHLPRLELALILLLTLVAQQQKTLTSPERIGAPIPTDLLFHAGNATELRHHFPPQDPRVAGLDLPYHFVSGIIPAAASVVTGAPVGLLALVVIPPMVISWMVIALVHAGRVLGESTGVGILGAAFVMFHVDVGPFLGLPPSAFLSFLRDGLYASDSTLLGLAGLGSLAVLLSHWLDEDRSRSAGLAIAVMVVASWIAGAKSSVIPVAGIGLILAGGAALLLHRNPRHCLSAAVLLGLGSAPFTLWLLTRATSHAAMFQWAPGVIARRSWFFANAGAWLGLSEVHSGLLNAVAVGGLTLTWVGGFLGPAALLGVAHLVQARDRHWARRAWVAGTAGCGLAIVLLVDAVGHSQLFFAYGGLVLLILTGAGLAASAAGQRLRLLWVSLIVVAFVPSARVAALGCLDGLAADLDAALVPQGDRVTRYGNGLAWLRRNAPRDAVLVFGHGALTAGVLAERRSFYATGFFTPEGHRLRRSRIREDPFPERLELRRRAVRLDLDALHRIRDLCGGTPDLWVVVDSVSVAGEPGLNALAVSVVPPEAEVPSGIARVYASDVMRIYVLVPQSEP